MRSRRRFGRKVAAFLVLVVVACAAIAVHTARRVEAAFHPPRKPIDVAARARAHAAVPTLEEVSFRTKDGVVLRGWYVPSKRRAAVILVHGGYDNRTQMMFELLDLSEHGYGVLAYDSRGDGESDG